MPGGNNESDIVQCPYNKDHLIVRKKFQMHVIKCRALHPNVDLRKCPFNTLHMVSIDEYEDHISQCEDRKIVDQYAPCEVKEDERVSHPKIISEENWSDEDEGDFVPEKSLPEYYKRLRRQVSSGRPEKTYAKPKNQEPDDEHENVGSNSKGDLNAKSSATMDKSKTSHTTYIKREYPPFDRPQRFHPPHLRERPPFYHNFPRGGGPRRWMPRPYLPAPYYYPRIHYGYPEYRRMALPLPPPQRRREPSPLEKDYSLDDDPYYSGEGSTNTTSSPKKPVEPSYPSPYHGYEASAIKPDPYYRPYMYY